MFHVKPLCLLTSFYVILPLDNRVSRETMHKKTLDSPEFVAGILSLTATFFHNHSARTENFGFQVKLSKENIGLMRLVRRTMSIENKIHLFTESGTTYALLNTRSKKTLIDCVIPFMDQYLCGPKLITYLKWREDLLNSI